MISIECFFEVLILCLEFAKLLLNLAELSDYFLARFLLMVEFAFHFGFLSLLFFHFVKDSCDVMLDLA